MEDDIHIGGFALREALGQGGMGVVHRAEHRRTGVSVAMKFLSAYAGNDKLREDFHREVQLAAALTHPGIVDVLDYGTVGEDEVPSHAAMKPGDPWLAMELATGGSLADVQITSWAELRWVLSSVLDALAHAHARGVVHRDLKPGNILVTRRGERRLVQLADFGIAHLRRESLGDTEISTTSPNSAGTPHFMAPEQIRGDWRNFGGWTDLYALGCVAYRLAAGRYLFSGKTAFMIWEQHMNAEPPALKSRLALPEGFEAWVRRLLSKHPRDRFRRAADAAWVLRSLPDPEPRPTAPHIDPDDEAAPTLVELGFATSDFSLMHAATLTAQSETAPLDELVGHTPDAGPAGRVEVVAPMPVHWRVSDHKTTSAYADIGLGLVGLRGVELAGRDDERDQLWAALRQVREERRSMVVALTGAAGLGKSALGRWLCERAHEVAGASILRVMHDAEGTAASGLSAAVERYLDGDGLASFELWERLRDLLRGRCDDPDQRAAAMVEVLRPGTHDDRIPDVVMASAMERAIALRDGIAAIIGARALLMWVDDAHLEAAKPTLDAVQAFVAPDAVGSTLALITMRDTGDRLEKLAPTTIELGAMDDDTLKSALRAMLPVSERAALTIVEHAEGVPLFAMHLLADWARSGRLVARDRGFEVDDLDQVTLPADVGELWRQRVNGLIEASGDPTTRKVLSAAAALGREVDLNELSWACGRLGVPIPAGIFDALIRRGIATPRRDGFSFAHSLLAQTIADDMDDELAADVFAACADAVGEAHEDHAQLLRVARLRLRAGQHEQAIDAALRSIELSWSDDRAARAGSAVAIVDEAADALSLPENDPRIVQAELWRIRGFRVRWDFAEVEQRATALLAVTDAPSGTHHRAEALIELGLAQGYSGGELERALPHFLAAADIFEELGDKKSLAEVLSRIAYVQTHQKQREDAIKAAEWSVALYREVGDPDGLARGLIALAQAHDDVDAERVVAIFEEAAELTERAGLRYWQANVLYGLAMIDEQRGHYHTAIDRLRKSQKICMQIGSTAVDACRVNLACLLVLTDATDEAALILRELEQRGTLAQLWKRARYPLLVLAERAGDEVRAAELRGEILAEPVDDPTTRALFVLARDARAS